MSYIVRQKARNGRVYVHLAQNHHIPELHQARQTRRHIGVLDLETSELRLAAGFPEPDQALLGLLAKAGITYAGRRAAPRGRCPAAAPRPDRRLAAEDDVSRVEEVGEAYVLGWLAQRAGLESALCTALGPEEGLAVLWSAMHQVCTAEPQYLADEWLAERQLPALVSQFDFSSAGLSGLSEALGRSPSCRHRFFQNWIAACGKPEAIILDTTSLSTYSDNLEQAEWGHNRDGENLPQVNFSLAISAVSHLPQAYRVNFGSIPDVATLQATSEFLREYGLERITYSADKGFWSNANAAAMIRAQLQFVMGVPLVATQAKALVNKHRRSLDAPKRSLLYGGHVVRHAWDQLKITMADQPAATVKAILFMEPERVANLTADFERRTLELEHQAARVPFPGPAEAKAWVQENAKALAKYFAVSAAGGKVQVRRLPHAIACRCNRAGVSLYATNRAKLTATDLLAIVRSRDAVEKVFDLLKNEDGQRRLRTGNPHRVEGRLFLAFVALILRVLLENRLREAALNKTRSVAEVLALLRKIKRMHFASGRKRLLEVPKRTRLLLEALDIPLPD
jgi:transposase